MLGRIAAFCCCGETMGVWAFGRLGVWRLAFGVLCLVSWATGARRKELHLAPRRAVSCTTPLDQSLA